MYDINALMHYLYKKAVIKSIRLETLFSKYPFQEVINLTNLRS